MTNFRIHVVSDTVCPWCYVGRKQLQRAQQLWQQQHPNSDDTFTVSYAPYQLNPHSTGGDKQAYFLRKFGAERTAQIHQHLRDVGRSVGIEFKWGGRVGNTRDSHRLIQLSKAYGNGVELKTVDGLFASFFENEGDIADHEILRAIATKAGIPEADFQKAIVDSDQGGPEFEEGIRQAQLSGIHGVPNYLIQGQIPVDGAREPAAFVRAFERVKMAEQRA